MIEQEDSMKQREFLIGQEEPRRSKAKSEYLPRRTERLTRVIPHRKESSELTQIATNHTMLIIAVAFVIVSCFYLYVGLFLMQISEIKPISSKIPLSRDDCLDLYRRYNCTLSRSNGQICQDLNQCIHASDQKQCLVTLKDEDDD
jgi:hypothetical protein